jgi:hypothetical protein
MADAPGFISMPARVPVRRALLLLVAVSLLLMASSPALGLVLPHPEQPKRLSITGGTIGKVGKHHRLRLVMTAADPKGFVDLESMTASLVLRGQILQQINYDIGGLTVQIAGQSAIRVGDRPAPEGAFFQIFPRHARYIRSTFSVNFTVWMYFLEGVSKDARWRFTAISRSGEPQRSAVAISYRVRLAPGFLSWGTLGLSAAVALFLGGFLGNTFTHRKYRAGEPSVWDIVERRLREQKARPPTVYAVRGDGGLR